MEHRRGLRYPKKVKRLPIISARKKSPGLIDSALTPFHHIVLMTLYATGVRRAELTRTEDHRYRQSTNIIHIQGGRAARIAT